MFEAILPLTLRLQVVGLNKATGKTFAFNVEQT
jgi:hypothetical protein